MPRRKPWSKIVEEAGIQVRLFEREPGGILYRSVVVEGRKDRKSLGHRDRNLAVEQAKALARALAELQLTGRPLGSLSFGELRRLYLHHRGPLLTPGRRQFMERALNLLGRYLEPNGRPFPIDDFSQTHADGYAQARRTGALRSDDPRTKPGAGPGTIRNELQALSTVCNWAVGFKVGGRRLLAHNPVRDIKMPVEPNPRRPVASAERYRRLLDVANQVDPAGRFRLMLALAYHTGRRINAICHLRTSDLLLTPDAVRAALASLGMDERIADAWPQAIRWRAEWDKQGFESIAPIGQALRREIDAYVRQNPAVGEAWLFPYHRRPGEPVPKYVADWWLGQAEKVAGLPHLERGGWHAFRRAWATARRALPIQDVMVAGGWRDVKALQTAYQQADPETVRAVVELGETA